MYGTGFSIARDVDAMFVWQTSDQGYYCMCWFTQVKKRRVNFADDDLSDPRCDVRNVEQRMSPARVCYEQAVHTSDDCVSCIRDVDAMCVW